ncbi:hypothetical protein ACGFIV_00970 [Sphaerisporangium sp. NPDC049003]|uniref:hypothetical protein n=1 Tax=Sphaerisporangium sp. NPDC049003 TaxID=3364517 RepID=UPI0037187E18
MTARTTDPATEEFLTAEQILEVDDRQWEDLPVPEWGGKVRVRGLQGTERDRFEASLLDSKGRAKIENARAKLAQLCLVDPKTGQLLFSKEQIAALGRKSAAALQRVFELAQKLSGLTDEDMEELEGN